MADSDGALNPSSGGVEYEPALNVALANLLAQQGIEVVRREQRQPGSRKRFDIEVKVGELTVALEAEIGSRIGALRDARRRLEQHESGTAVAHGAIAVSYPKTLNVAEFDETAEFEWAVLPSEQFTVGRASDLASAIRRIPEQRGDPEAVAGVLDAALAQAAEEMTSRQINNVAAALDLPRPLTAGTRREIEVSRRTTAKRGLLVIAAAAMFHSRLDDHLPVDRPETHARTGKPYNGPWPPSNLPTCIAADDPVDALNMAWEAIQAVDYRPIFESACRALMATARNEGWLSAVRRVAAAAQLAAAKPSGRSHDLVGRIFHRLLDSARYDGSFYTSTSAAVLLAGLAIPDNGLPDDLLSYRVIDPACGTGTLLMAAAERVRDLRPEDARQADAEALIEEVIWGLDVNTTACHMAATTLGLMSPSTAFRSMNIHMMDLGAEDLTGTADQGGAESVDVRVGSLELLARRGDGDADPPRLAVPWSAGRQVDTEEEIEVDPNSFDLVIMNPPYTRDSLRHNQFTSDEEKRLKKREKQLMAGRAGHGSSSGTMFIDLGEHLVGLEPASTLAVVFPLSGAGAPSSSDVRKLLADWFHIEWVIASHDPKRSSFSENTDISEMLVVARRHPEGDPAKRPPTKFVCLRQNSRLATDALSVAAHLRTGTLDESVGSITEWPAARMAEGEWRPLGLTSARLVELSRQVADGELFPVSQLGDTAEIGPAGQRIREAYTKYTTADKEGRTALWHNDTKLVRTLAVSPDTYIRISPDKPDQKPGTNRRRGDKYWNQRSSLFFCEKARLTTARLLATKTKEKTVGSHWIPLRPRKGDEQYEKAICVWLNSTLGFLGAISVAAPNILERQNFSLDAISRIPVPEFDDGQTALLAGAFDSSSGKMLLRFAESDEDETREAMDKAISRALEVPEDIIGQARSELTREPSLTRRTDR